jgi:subtilisin-like proprotein convertase family protein
MDTRSSAIRMVAALFLVMVFPSVGFPDPVYIYSGNFNLPIPANPDDTKGWMADAIIEVPDHFVISDLDAGISLTHTNVFDLQIFLQSPAGTRICLNMYDYDEFFIGANYTNTIFDDEAPFSIREGEVPFTGRFRPLEPDKLSEFDGEDTYGSWRLRIYDAWDWDTGTFNHLELMITTPEPATAVLLTFGIGLVALFKPNHRSY